MSQPTTIANLEERIEQLVREHMAASRAAAIAAVTRAFTDQAVPAPTQASQPRQTKRKGKPATQRRTAAEIDELADKFCSEVLKEPGATMLVLAPRVGATADQLSVAVKRLRQAERIRTVGHRHQTRYYPAGATLDEVATLDEAA